MSRIGIMGGSFNPPHFGHIRVAEAIYKEFNLDKMLFMPLHNAPHKNNVVDGLLRKEMCEILLEGVENVELSLIEMNREGMTYTYDTLKYLKDNNPDLEIYYVIGTDTLLYFETWYRFSDVINMSEFICVKRPGTVEEDVISKLDELKKKYNKTIYFSSFNPPDISSTDIRNCLENNVSLAGMVPEKLEKYIKEHNLYV